MVLAHMGNSITSDAAGAINKYSTVHLAQHPLL